MTAGNLDILFNPELPGWAIVALAAAAVLALLPGLIARAPGTLFRAFAAATVILALCGPSLVHEKREPLKDIAFVVVDETASQVLTGKQAETEQALEAVTGKLDAYSDRLDVRIVRVGSGTGSPGDTEGRNGTGTRLFDALKRASSDVPPGRIAGTVMITDGEVHDVPATTTAADADSDAESANTGQGWRPDAPVHALITGHEGEKDRRIVIEEAPAYGVVGETANVTIRVLEEGMKSEAPVSVDMNVHGGQKRRLTVPVGIAMPVPVNIERRGKTLVEFSVAPVDGEATVVNNRAVATINGVRDRLRVLLVSGEPYPGERTWRNLLKSDPSVDLIHFTILRPPEKQDTVPITELSLIAFPTRQLFEVKLKDFDLVVFDRYRRRGVLPPAYLGNVVDYVRKGGGVLVVAGPAFAGPFSLSSSPIGDILPANPTGAVIQAPFRPTVTDQGRRHPVTAPLAEMENSKNAAPWGHWFRRVELSGNDGETLMSDPSGEPLLVLNRFGKGRIAVLGSDQIWLWARGFEGGGPHADLIRRLSHWLMKEPELEEDDLNATVENNSIHIVRRSLTPISGSVKLTRPDAESAIVTLSQTAPGRYEGTAAASSPGVYVVEDGKLSVAVAKGSADPLELGPIVSTTSRLTPFTERTQGSTRRIADGIPDIRLVRNGRDFSGNGRVGGNPGWIGLKETGSYRVTGVESAPLLPPALALAIVVFLLGAAWLREGTGRRLPPQ